MRVNLLKLLESKEVLALIFAGEKKNLFVLKVGGTKKSILGHKE